MLDYQKDYCEFIADHIQKALLLVSLYSTELPRIDNVGHVQSDQHPTEGYPLSTKKKIEVEAYGKKYIVTVEEA
jgi:hypothetical protein